jgi:hypothetical protein
MTMTKPTSEQVTFLQQGLGAVQRNVVDKLRETVSVTDFGAKGDGVTDDTAAIQAAIDWSMYRNNPLPGNVSVIPSVFIPAGNYRITDTIHLGYGIAFASVHLRGDGRKYRGEPRFGGTAIIADFNDRPAIAIQGGRDSSVQALTIVGKNYDWVRNNKLGSAEIPLIDDLVEANWVDSSFPASASSRYAPYCAIAIDPYSGPRPAVSYPDVNYPSWSGVTTQYNKNPSADITLRDIEISGFVVGVAIQPCDFDTTGDFVKIDTAGIEACQYVLSIGQSQSRDVLMNNCKCQFNYCGVTTGKHGQQNGDPSIDIRNTSFNFGIMCAFIPTMQNGSNVAFRNVYSEAIYMIGDFSGGGGNLTSSVGFDECEFAFDLWYIGRGIPASPYLNLFGATTFSGCRFNLFQPSGQPPRMVLFNCNATKTAFVNCQLATIDPASTLYEKVAVNATSGLVLRNCDTRVADWSWQSTYLYDLSTGNNIPQNGGHNHNQTFVEVPSRRCGIPVYAKHLYTTNVGDFDYGIPIPRVTSVSGKTTMTSVSQSGRTVTVNMTGSRTALQCAATGGDVGDVVYDDVSGTIFIVSSRTGATIEMVAQNNLDSALTSLVPTISLASGSLWFLNCRMFAMNFVHYGDISSSSATISNVVGADGTSRNVDSATLGVQAGDYALGGDGFATGVASPTNSLISSVTSNSIVLTGNARYTATRERLGLFVRAATANNA